jgi:glycosyltransferase involved in cell wall biosynthesis
VTAELVTVVIPCYNASQYIEDTLNSVLKQRESDILDVEVIVVDDGSIDDSPAKIEAAALANPGTIRLLRQPWNLGPAAARNLGLRQAKGRFICFLDSDDQYAPGFFSHSLAHFRQRPRLAAIFTGIELVDCHREVHPAQRWTMVQSLPSNVILKKSVADLLGGFPEDEVFRGKAAGEDCAFRSLLAKMFAIVYNPTEFLRYRVKRGSHFDYFLDRTRVVDNQVLFKENSEEELLPAFGEASRNYQDRCYGRTVAAFTSTIGASEPGGRLQEIERFEDLRSRFADVGGFLHPVEGYALYQLSKDGPSTGKIVEIGSFMGLSTCWLAAGSMAAGRRRVVAIDHFKGSSEHQPGGSHQVEAIATIGSTYPQFEENIRNKGLSDWVEIRIGDAGEIAGDWSEPVRMLFIDGDHSYEMTRRDVECWSRFINDEGLMALHDVGVWPGVTEFYDQLLAAGTWRETMRVRSLRIVQRAS